MVAFADDLIFFLTDPLVSFPKLLQYLHEYGTLSFFQINLSKSSVLNIMVDSAMTLSLRSSFSLRWVIDSIHYLGVNITSDLSALYSANFAPLLLRIKANILHWRSLTLTWFEHCSALKMTMLPKVLLYICCRHFPFASPWCSFNR